MQPRLLNRYRKSLHLKITVPALAIMIAVVSTLSIFAAVLVKDSLRHTVYESARSHAVLMSDDHTVVLGMLNKDPSDLDGILETAMDSTGAAVAVAVYTREQDGTHELLHRMVKRPHHAVLFPPAWGESARTSRERSPWIGMTMRSWSSPLPSGCPGCIRSHPPAR